MKLGKRVGETIITLLLIIIACGFYGGEVKAETLGDWEYSVNENEVTITKYIGTDTEVFIPEKIDGKSVTCIGYNAFSGCRSLTSIEIPNSVTSICGYAFWNCESLTSIEIPNSVTSIDEMAFNRCSSLSSIKVDNGNSKYDSRNDCNAIIETKSGNLIAGCKNTDIPEGVTSLGNNAFEGCTSLTSIEIPNSVTRIMYHVFRDCSSLTSIEIPDSVKSIGNNAFWGCSGLTSIKVDSENSIYDSRNGCNAIIEKESGKLIVGCINTDIPEDVTSIGDSAFWGCSSLTGIEIPNSVTSIGDQAFECCSSLTSIEIPNSVMSIGDSAFGNCESLTSIEIPNSVTSIGNYAFYSCSSLTGIEIPNSVTSIGDHAFECCSSLTSIKVDSGNPKYDSRNDCNAIIEKESGKLIIGCKNTDIPEDVTSIERYAFKGCANLTSIEIPNSVTSIGDDAFDGCANAEFYVEKGSYAEQYLKDNGIEYTYKHTPEIDPEVRPTCTKTGLTEGSHCAICGEIIVKQKIVPADGHKWDEGKVTKEPTETEKGIKIFTCSVCKATKTEEIPVKDTSKSKSVKKAGIGTISADGKTLTDTDGTKYLVAEKIDNKQLKKNANIADKKTAGKYKITKITKKKGKITGGTITYIKPYNMNSKTANIKASIKIAGATFKVTLLNKNAFKNCNKLTKVTIGANITKIGANAFSGCKKLKTITIKTTKLKSIGAKAFKSINSKAKFKLPKNLKKKQVTKYTKMIKKAKAPKGAKISK